MGLTMGRMLGRSENENVPLLPEVFKVNAKDDLLELVC